MCHVTLFCLIQKRNLQKNTNQKRQLSLINFIMNQATLTHINFHQENQISPQKRKAKAAISVQALHDLEEIAHPGDSFLYYQDVEKEKNVGNTSQTRRIHCSVFNNKPFINKTFKFKFIIKQLFKKRCRYFFSFYFTFNFLNVGCFNL